MKRLFALLLTVGVTLGLVIPVLATSPEVGDGLDSGTGVENVTPVIEEGSLLVQIVDDDGTAWQWQDGGNSGDRAAPYIFDGEKLRLELDVSDANGTDDLSGMQVKVALDSAAQFLCNLESTTIDPANEISKGHYSGDLPIDGGIAQGMYDIAVTVTDAQGASDYYNPTIYQDTVDILMKPTLTLEKTKSSVTFPSCKPGAQDVAASENPIGLRPQAVIGSEHVPVVFSILQLGTDMKSTSGEDAIPVGSITWSLNTEPAGATVVSAERQVVANLVKEGETIQVYYWLNAPLPQASGTYTGKIEYKITAD